MSDAAHSQVVEEGKGGGWGRRAMLEAEAKARANPKQKSINLGSHRWLAEYAPTEKEKPEPRPYHFV